MKVSPSNIEVLKGDWSNLPTGLAVGFTDKKYWPKQWKQKKTVRLPVAFALKTVEARDDYEIMKDDPKVQAIMLTRFLHGRNYGLNGDPYVFV